MSFDSSIHLSNHHTKQIQKTHTLYHTEAAPRFPAPAISPFGLFLCFKEMGLFGLCTGLWLLCLRMVRRAKSWSFLLCHRALLEGGVAVDPFSFAGMCSLPTSGLVRIRLRRCSRRSCPSWKWNCWASGQLQPSLHDVRSHVLPTADVYAWSCCSETYQTWLPRHFMF